MKPFVGTGIFARTTDGNVTMLGAYSYPWKNNLILGQWITPNGGWAGSPGLHISIYDGNDLIFQVNKVNTFNKYDKN